MSTIAENLQRLSDAKNDIAEAIEEKGVPVAKTDGLETFSGKIRLITSTAADVSYDNTISGIDADNTQDAIDALSGAVDGKIVSPSTAAVGQVLIVKAVDSTGKPSEWEAVNMGSRYTMTLDSETATLNITTLDGDS